MATAAAPAPTTSPAPAPAPAPAAAPPMAYPTGLPNGLPNGLPTTAPATASAAVAAEGPKLSSVKVHTTSELRSLVQAKNVVFGKLKARKQGIGFDVGIRGVKGSIRAQFGSVDKPLTTPFGVKLRELSDEEKAKGKTHADPYRKDLDAGVSAVDHADYRAFGTEWDEYSLDEFTARSAEFFGDERDRSGAKIGFVKTIRPPQPPKDPAKKEKWDAEKAKTWDPTHRFKVVTEGPNKTHVKKIIKTTTLPNGKKKYVRADAHADEITKFCRVVVIADCIGGWIAGGQHGLSWQATDIMFFPAEEWKLPSAFNKNDDEEFDDVDATEAAALADNGEVDPTDVDANASNAADTAMAAAFNTAPSGPPQMLAGPADTTETTAPTAAPAEAPAAAAAPAAVAEAPAPAPAENDDGPVVVAPTPAVAAEAAATDAPAKPPKRKWKVPSLDGEDDVGDDDVSPPPTKRHKKEKE